MMKKGRATFLVEPSLWHEFQRVCRAQDTTASRELRRFMREYLRKHAQVNWLEEHNG